MKWKKIAINPVTDADPPSVKYEEMSIWSLNEIQKFLQECKGERHYLTFLLAFYTGMRRGEILGLQWNDVDFGNKMIHVCPKKWLYTNDIENKKLETSNPDSRICSSRITYA